jgi:hypothetical protein
MTEPGSTCVRWLAVNVVAAAMGVAAGCAGNSDTVSRPGTVSPTSRSSAAGLQTRGFIWGVQGHPGNQAYEASAEGLARQLDYLESLGASHYRVDVNPDSAGTVHPAFERILEASAARSIEILPVLVTHPDSAAPESLNYSRGYAIGFNFASRYRGRFTHVEAGNELDNRVLKFTIDSTLRPAKHNYYEGSSIDQYVDSLLGKTTGFLRGMTEGNPSRGAGNQGHHQRGL